MEWQNELIKIINRTIKDLNNLGWKIAKTHRQEKKSENPTYEEVLIWQFQIYFNFMSNLMNSYLEAQSKFSKKFSGTEKEDVTESKKVELSNVGRHSLPSEIPESKEVKRK